jgi:hypothetical protein
MASSAGKRTTAQPERYKPAETHCLDDFDSTDEESMESTESSSPEPTLEDLAFIDTRKTKDLSASECSTEEEEATSTDNESDSDFVPDDSNSS